MPLTGFESRGIGGGCRACRSLEHRTCGKEEVNGEQSAVVPGRRPGNRTAVALRETLRELVKLARAQASHLEMLMY